MLQWLYILQEVDMEDYTLIGVFTKTISQLQKSCYLRHISRKYYIFLWPVMMVIQKGRSNDDQDHNEDSCSCNEGGIIPDTSRCCC